MLLMLEQNLDTINIAVKVKVARDLTKMHKGNELLVKILAGLEKDIGYMSFNEAATMLWILAKNKVRNEKSVLIITGRIR